MEKEHIDLGWVNGWTETPAVLRDAWLQGYREKEVSSRNCVHAYRLETPAAVITWKEDTSG